MNTFLEEIRSVWFGKAKLWKVFWIYGSLIGTAISFLIDYLFFEGLFVLSIIGLAFYTVFFVWVSKGMYACRFNSKNPNGLMSKAIPIFIALNIALFIFSVPRFFSQMEKFRENPDLLNDVKKFEIKK